ncbi:hypothetical protein FQR65_LT03558 [Abscondita terminalis]|nr:hypothetical protein FQR65_LT03558 [Abscondita terminalis]
MSREVQNKHDSVKKPEDESIFTMTFNIDTFKVDYKTVDVNKIRKSHEENDKVLFSNRVKVDIYTEKGWKDSYDGVLKIVEHKNTKRMRMLMMNNGEKYIDLDVTEDISIYRSTPKLVHVNSNFIDFLSEFECENIADCFVAVFEKLETIPPTETFRNENELFSSEAQIDLYTVKGWKKNCKGILQILKDKNTRQVRILMKCLKEKTICVDLCLTKDVSVHRLHKKCVMIINNCVEFSLLFEHLDIELTSESLANDFFLVLHSLSLTNADEDTRNSTSDDQEDINETFVESPPHETLYSCNAKLFRIVDGKWKKRGAGELRIIFTVDTKKLKVLMVNKLTSKLILNHYLVDNFKYEKKGDKAWLFKIPKYSNKKLKWWELYLSFKTSTVAEEFMHAVDGVLKTFRTSRLVTSEPAIIPQPQTPSEEIVSVDTKASPDAMGDNSESTEDQDQPKKSKDEQSPESVKQAIKENDESCARVTSEPAIIPQPQTPSEEIVSVDTKASPDAMGDNSESTEDQDQPKKSKDEQSPESVKQAIKVTSEPAIIPQPQTPSEEIVSIDTKASPDAMGDNSESTEDQDQPKKSKDEQSPESVEQAIKESTLNLKVSSDDLQNDESCARVTSEPAIIPQPQTPSEEIVSIDTKASPDAMGDNSESTEDQDQPKKSKDEQSPESVEQAIKESTLNLKVSSDDLENDESCARVTSEPAIKPQSQTPPEKVVSIETKTSADAIGDNPESPKDEEQSKQLRDEQLESVEQAKKESTLNLKVSSDDLENDESCSRVTSEPAIIPQPQTPSEEIVSIDTKASPDAMGDNSESTEDQDQPKKSKDEPVRRESHQDQPKKSKDEQSPESVEQAIKESTLNLKVSSDDLENDESCPRVTSEPAIIPQPQTPSEEIVSSDTKASPDAMGDNSESTEDQDQPKKSKEEQSPESVEQAIKENDESCSRVTSEPAIIPQPQTPSEEIVSVDTKASPDAMGDNSESTEDQDQPKKSKDEQLPESVEQAIKESRLNLKVSSDDLENDESCPRVTSEPAIIPQPQTPSEEIVSVDTKASPDAMGDNSESTEDQDQPKKSKVEQSPDSVEQAKKDLEIDRLVREWLPKKLNQKKSNQIKMPLPTANNETSKRTLQNKLVTMSTVEDLPNLLFNYFNLIETCFFIVLL